MNTSDLPGDGFTGQFRVLMVKEENSQSTNGFDVCDTPDKMIKFWRENIEKASWFEPEKECVVVIVLDVKLRVKGWNLVSLGSISASIVEPREVFRPIIVSAGKCFVLMHNHPSGDPTPSNSDITITRELKQCAEIFKISFVDHVIVGDAQIDKFNGGKYSFRASGLL